MTRLLLPALALLLVPVVSAQTHAVSGTAAYIIDESQRVERPDGTHLAFVTMRAVAIEDDPASPLHLAVDDCAGTHLFAADGAPVQFAGICTATDPDGDIRWYAFFNSPERTRWTCLGGTGTFEGATCEGTSEVLGVGYDSRATIRYTGEITMPSATR